jgi:hypothetical protein
MGEMTIYFSVNDLYVWAFDSAQVCCPLGIAGRVDNYSARGGVLGSLNWHSIGQRSKASSKRRAQAVALLGETPIAVSSESTIPSYPRR